MYVHELDLIPTSEDLSLMRLHDDVYEAEFNDVAFAADVAMADVLWGDVMTRAEEEDEFTPSAWDELVASLSSHNEALDEEAEMTLLITKLLGADS